MDGDGLNVLVDEAHLAMAEDQGRLTALEPRIEFTTLTRTLVTTARRLSVAGRGTATFPNALVVGAPVVG